MSDQPHRNWFATFLIELFKIAPILAAIWISLEANKLSQLQLHSSEETLQRTYAPVLITEQPLFNEALRGGQPSHFEFFTRVVNLSQNPAHNLSAQLYVGDEAILETPKTAPILAGVQSQLPEDIRLRRDFAISVEIPIDKAGAILDGESLLKLVFEHEDLFENRLRTTIRYQMDDSGRMPALRTIETTTDHLDQKE